MPLLASHANTYSPTLPRAWADLIGKAGMEKLDFALQFAAQEARSKQLLPAERDCFKTFEMLAPEDVSVVLAGQDPYPTPGHAMGLCFSVPKGIALARSLANIYREMVSDLAIPAPKDGDLTHWCQQGILMANSALTVPAGDAGAHAKAWMPFTKAWIEALGNDGKPRVWLLWGSKAQAFKDMIGPGNVVIESVHPSPLSASRGFFGSKPFSKVNAALVSLGKPEIRWA